MKRILCILAALCLAPCMSPASAQSVDASARLAELGYLRAGGEDMDTAVRNFQTANGLEVTGGLDEATLQALADEEALSKTSYLQALAGRYAGVALESGNTGDDVRAMQQALRDLGYYTGGTDGVFGDATRVAVVAFQDRQRPGPHRTADGAMLMLLHEGKTLTWQNFIAGKLCQRGDSGAAVRSLQRRLKGMGLLRRRVHRRLWRGHTARAAVLSGTERPGGHRRSRRGPPAACSTPGRAYRSWTMAYCARATRARPSAHCNSSSMPSATWQCSPTATLARTPTWP